MFVCYPHGSPSHAGVDCQRALTRGADALHDNTENAPSTVLGLANQAVIQVDFPAKKELNQILWYLLSGPFVVWLWILVDSQS